MATPAEFLTQSLAKFRTANRIDGTKNSYRRDNPNEYTAVLAYLDGGPRPTTVTTDMGVALLLEEDARRALGTPWPEPEPEPEPQPGDVFLVPNTIDNTGATDVTAALQAWINTVPNGTATAPHVLRFGAGIYRINSQLTVTGRSHLAFDSDQQTAGGNAELRWTTPVALNGGFYAGDDELRLLRFTDCNDITVRFLTLRGPAPMPASGDGFKPWEFVQHMHTLVVSRCAGFTVDKLKISGAPGDGINWGNENSGTRSTGVVMGCEVSECHRCGIALVGSGGVTIRDNTFLRIGMWTIDAEPNNLASSNYDTLVENNRFLSQGSLVSRTAVGAFAGSKDGQGLCDGFTIRNNTFDGRTAEIRFNTNINGAYPYPQRVKRVRIENNTCNMNSPQVELRQIDTLDVSGNDFQVASGTEIGVWQVTDMRIAGSTFTVG